jgi:hypothetical protein
MSDLETRLREALHKAPPALDASNLFEGAHRYAIKARRVRLAAMVATVALVVVVGGAAASGAWRDHALTPAHPVQHLKCALTSQAGPAPPGSGSTPLSQRYAEVLVCADRSSASVWRGSLPPDEAISTAGMIDYLRFDPAPGGPCPQAPAGPAFRMLLLDHAGRVSAYDNQALACNGWQALDRYWVALGNQEDALAPIQIPDPFPQCPSILYQQVKPPSAASPALRAGTVFTAATYCGYWLADAMRTPAADPGPQSLNRGVLSAEQLARLNAQIAHTGSVKGPHPECITAGAATLNTIQAVTASGTHIVFSWACPGSDRALVNWAQDDTVLWPHSVIVDLTTN